MGGRGDGTPRPGPGGKGEGRFQEGIRRAEGRRLRGRARGPAAVLATIGMVGWTVSLPMLGGLALGLWIDGLAGGGRSFGIMLMIGGLFLGCLGAWSWIRRRSAGEEGDDEHHA